MKKVNEFRERATNCRELAKTSVSADLQQHYHRLAEMWDRLAEERITFFIPEAVKEAG